MEVAIGMLQMGRRTLFYRSEFESFIILSC